MKRRSTFEDFYTANFRRVAAVAIISGANRLEAEELAQEAMSRAWSAWEKLEQYDDPAAWTCNVAHRLTISRWRATKSALRAYRRSGVPANIEPPNAAHIALREALLELPAGQRRSLTLHYFGGLTVAEFAQADRVPEGTVKTHLARGRRKLAELLGADADEPAVAAGKGPGNESR